jgi:transcriptional regulator with XRE-family HTH domain
MVIGDKLKELRAMKELSQGDIEKRTGLLRCYISRVENGHTVPSVDTLEKMARAWKCRCIGFSQMAFTLRSRTFLS